MIVLERIAMVIFIYHQIKIKLDLECLFSFFSILSFPWLLMEKCLCISQLYTYHVLIPEKPADDI